MSLESLHIQGFQKHKNRKLEFGPQITCIIGETDGGKSSCFRALRWLCQNKSPAGNFIHWDHKFSKVSLKIDSKTIIRKKGSSTNLYSLDGKKFKAFGTEVPPEILNLLNLGKENFQGQHDSLFWFSETAGQVSKDLNRIVDLAAMDHSLSKINADLRDARSNVKLTESRLKEAEKKQQELLWVEEANEAFSAIEEQQQNLQKKQETLQSCLQIQIQISGIQKSQQTFSEKIQRISAVTGLMDLIIEKKELLERSLKLVKMIEQTQKKVEELRSSSEEIQKEMAEKFKNCPVCGTPFKGDKNELETD